MGLANTNFGYGNNRAQYLYQAQFIASFYKGNLNIEDKCECNISGWELLLLSYIADDVKR